MLCDMAVKKASNEGEKGGGGKEEGNVLFNDALNTFYLWLYGTGIFIFKLKNKRRP